MRAYWEIRGVFWERMTALRKDLQMATKPIIGPEEWDALEQDIIEAFTPGTAINESELLAGRTAKTKQLQTTALDAGRHAVIYGERGVGKTSIANTFHKSLNKPTRTVVAVSVNCDLGDTFDSMWRKVFRRIKHVSADGESWADQSHPVPMSVDDVVTELSSFPPEYCPIIILDEFDRLRNEEAKALCADVIKSLSDYNANCTLVLVGVAKSVRDLISNHASIQRALVQVTMPRLGKLELADIVRLRLRRLGMSIDEHALWRITFLSAGLPFYTHALGRHSALRAVQSKKKGITEQHVFDAMKDCIADVDSSMKEAYAKATSRIYNKDNLFPQVVAACALAEPDVLGKFSAVSVEAPLFEITSKPAKSANFGFHLNELSKPERGAILEKSGERRTYRFNFAEPLMQPYIMMQSISDGLITQETLTQRIAKAQMKLI